jgi:hypothetical protein
MRTARQHYEPARYAQNAPCRALLMPAAPLPPIAFADYFIFHYRGGEARCRCA